MTLDEIEWQEVYKTAADAISRISDPSMKTAAALLGQLLFALNERVTELQGDVDEC